MVAFGEKLRKLHLMENVASQQNMANFPNAGSNVVEKPTATVGADLRVCPDNKRVCPDDEGTRPKNKGAHIGAPQQAPQQTLRVFINDTQYFDNVPQTAWEFYIGGYQPAQKWLKDRKGRKLSYEDIEHYQRIVAVLWETAEIQKEIEEYTI